MHSGVVSADTQAVLLLTTGLSTRTAEGVNPLTHGEYNKLALALHENGLRPSDLLATAAADFIAHEDAHTIAPERLHQLLQRSMALAITLEAWDNSGFWVISRGDKEYPARLRERLRGKAPILLFGCGESDLLDQGGIAIVGSRNVDEDGQKFTRQIAREAAAEGIQVVSGGARGVDALAMETALVRGGTVVGVLANNLAKTSRSASVREAIQDDRLCLVSPFQPDTHFEAWRAMDRNKSIYALSDWAVVVSSDLRKGGTWAGAKENLDGGWVPLFVRSGGEIPRGNDALIELGGLPLSSSDLDDLRAALRESPPLVREIAPVDKVDPGMPPLTLF